MRECLFCELDLISMAMFISRRNDLGFFFSISCLFTGYFIDIFSSFRQFHFLKSVFSY